MRGSEVRQLFGMTNVIRIEQSNREGGATELSWINSWMVGHPSFTGLGKSCPLYVQLLWNRDRLGAAVTR